MIGCADDTILFLSKGVWGFKNVLTVLQIFESVFDLKVSLSKCGLDGINMESQMLSEYALLVGCMVKEWPIIYLGVPLGGNHWSSHSWNLVVEKVSKCLDGWKRAYFYLGGRLTFIAINYPFHFKIPVGVAERLGLMRHFLWSGTGDERRYHLLAWIDVGRSEEGWLGIKNISLIGKWLWHFPLEPHSFWRKVVRSKFGVQQNSWDADVSPPLT